MVNSQNFFITKKEGINFSKISGDINKIHINDSTGYNSLFGFRIVHGVLLLLKFFQQIKISSKINNKDQYIIEINYKNPTKYNSKITSLLFKKESDIFYKLFQENKIIATIKINFKNNLLVKKLNKISYKKKYLLSKKLINKFSNPYIPKKLGVILCNLSKYVGTVYPGKNSLIQYIKINYNTSFKESNLVTITSSLIDKRFPNIENNLLYKNYKIEFQTLIRPELNIKLTKPNKKILKEIKKNKRNILIIGASSGIGNDLLKLFLNNRNIKIIGTYYKNKINSKQKNLIVKKIDISKDINLIYDIIIKFNPLIIYYFPTPKIQINLKDKNLIKLYRNYYINYPIRIIKFANKFDINFFYPSTTFIDNNYSSSYAYTKLSAEKKLLKLNKQKNNINVVRIEEINTKQNLSLLQRNLKNFRDIIMKNKTIFNKVFFKNMK